jgi:hypothetical protein
VAGSGLSRDGDPRKTDGGFQGAADVGSLPLRRLLGQSLIVHLHMPKLALDYPKRVLHIGPDARLALLSNSLTLQ